MLWSMSPNSHTYLYRCRLCSRTSCCVQKLVLKKLCGLGASLETLALLKGPSSCIVGEPMIGCVCSAMFAVWFILVQPHARSGGACTIFVKVTFIGKGTYIGKGSILERYIHWEKNSIGKGTRWAKNQYGEKDASETGANELCFDWLNFQRRHLRAMVRSLLRNPSFHNQSSRREARIQFSTRAFAMTTDTCHASQPQNVAMFAAGCDWGVQLAFDRIPGVLETSVGSSRRVPWIDPHTPRCAQARRSMLKPLRSYLTTARYRMTRYCQSSGPFTTLRR